MVDEKIKTEETQISFSKEGYDSYDDCVEKRCKPIPKDQNSEYCVNLFSKARN